jgi:hypothetical protein
MAPAVAPIPPGAMKAILELYGFKLIAEDEFNWVLGDPAQLESEPVIIPRIGDLLAVDVMMQALIDSKIPFGLYLTLKAKVLGDDWSYNAKAAPEPPKH